jgi:hypothetical protein
MPETLLLGVTVSEPSLLPGSARLSIVMPAVDGTDILPVALVPASRRVKFAVLFRVNLPVVVTLNRTMDVVAFTLMVTLLLPDCHMKYEYVYPDEAGISLLKVRVLLL